MVEGKAMSETVSQRLGQGDAELITAVRAGDNTAYGALFERHRSAALRLARQLIPGTESEDLVSEAFTKVLIQLQAGRGPDLAFRAYLLTSIRRLHVDRIRFAAHVRTTDDEAELDQPVEFFDLAVANFERGTAADAFASLPERWQLVLWHLDVEGQKPADVAPLLGMSANSVSALAYRAREGLRQSYLQHHLADTTEGNCRWTTERLGAHVRKGLSNRDAARVDEHLDDCRRCMGIYLELIEVNSNLSGILAPALLGTAAAGYLAAGSTAAATAGAAIGLKALASTGIESVKAAVAGAGVQGAASVVVVAALAATGVYAVAGGLGEDDPAAVKSPAAVAPVVPAPTTGTGSEPGEAGEPSDGPTVETTPGPTVEPFEPTLPLGASVEEPSASPPVVVPPSDPTDDPPDDPPPPVVDGTDLGIGDISVKDDRFFGRRVTIPVTSKGEAKGLALTLTIEFDDEVYLLELVGSDWDCGDLHQPSRIKSLTCTRKQSGSVVPSFVFRASATLREPNVKAKATITAKDNVDRPTENDSRPFEVNLLPSMS